jgi:hypothetical protein
MSPRTMLAPSWSATWLCTLRAMALEGLNIGGQI